MEGLLFYTMLPEAATSIHPIIIMTNKSKKGTSAPHTPLTDAQRQLIVDHIDSANDIAKRYVRLVLKRGITLQELQTESCSALCEAALRFDPEQGTDFMAYAYHWCRKYIIAYIENWGYVAEDITMLPEEISADDGEAEEFQRERVAALMAVLNQQETMVVRLLYGFDGDPMDFGEVARLMHLSSRRIHQIYEKAMSKMELSTPYFSKTKAKN